MPTVKINKTEMERRRKARNEYSRKWKAAHPKQVKKWNSEWLKAQRKIMAAKKKGPKSVKRPHRPSPTVQMPSQPEKAA